jgi:hypothetical protein
MLGIKRPFTGLIQLTIGPLKLSHYVTPGRGHRALALDWRGKLRWSIDYGARFRRRAKRVRAVWSDLRWRAWSLWPFPVYAVCRSRDCDHYHTEYASRFRTGHLYRRAVERSYQYAEGPVSWYRVSRKAFASHPGWEYDEAAERAGY